MVDLPEDVRRIVAYSAALDGILRYGGSFSAWEELNEWEDTPRDAGLYLIGLKLGIQYPRGISRIAYIGSTRNLRTRIQAHNTNSHNYRLEQLKRRYPSGFVVTWTALPGLSLEWLRALEDAALQEADRQFGLYPICNEGRIDSPKLECCAGVIRISPCEELPYPLSVDCLCQQLETKALGRLPDRMPDEYYAGKSRIGTTVVISFGTSQEPIEDNEPIGNREAPTWITDENVATWDAPKFERIIKICAGLTPLPKTSTVRRFAAHNHRVPRPDTWGEVALVQARILAGTWSPKERLWVRIVCGKVLLGDAKLEPNGFWAEDKSDLPQTRKRPNICESKRWCEEAEAIQGELPADFVPKVYEIAELPEDDNPLAVEHLRLLAAARAFDIEQARQNAEYDRQHAIDLDKERRQRELLNERIEATFQQALIRTGQEQGIPPNRA